MEIIARATVAFLCLWFLIRAMGKRELAEMTAFELVLLVAMGDLVQQGITQEDMSLTGAFLAVGTIALWSVFFSYVSFRWARTRPLLEGIPILVVRDGHVLEEALATERLSVEELMEAARAQGISSLSSVKFGILETDGRFSFLGQDLPRRVGDDPSDF